MKWDDVTAGITAFVNAAKPIVEGAVAVAAPELMAGLSIGEKIVQGMLAEIPAAKALYVQITSGTPATKDQIAQLEADYEASYQKLRADIAAKLAALP